MTRTIQTDGGDTLSHTAMALSPAEAIKMMCEVSDQNKALVRRVDGLMGGISEMLEESMLFRDDMRKIVEQIGSKMDEAMTLTIESMREGTESSDKVIVGMKGVVHSLEVLVYELRTR